jgi:DNA-directed RNA polymerase subunit M/transcription elongation factor TFIIS
MADPKKNLYECPKCGGTEIEFREYILRKYPAGKQEDGKLIFNAEADEMVWGDYKDSHLHCLKCGNNFQSLPGKIDFR